MQHQTDRAFKKFYLHAGDEYIHTIACGTQLCILFIQISTVGAINVKDTVSVSPHLPRHPQVLSRFYD